MLLSWKRKGSYTSVQYAKHFEVYVVVAFYAFYRIILNTLCLTSVLLMKQVYCNNFHPFILDYNFYLILKVLIA